MNTPPGDHQELKALLGSLRDGLIDEAQLDRLDRILADDPDARRYYFEYIDLCTTLRHYQGISGGVTDAGDGEGRRTDGDAPGRRRRTALSRPAKAFGTLAAAAALAGAVVFGTRLLRPGAEQAPAPAAVVAGEGGPIPGRAPGLAFAGNIAVLTRAVNPVWGPTGLPTEPGSALTAGRLMLDSGLIQLEFYGGVIVVLEGPADFELISTDRAFCRRGKLRVRVPLKASRFSVGTPKTDVVDLGTEFGVVVDAAGGSEVQVFEGSVELHDDARGRDGGRLLSMGEGLKIDAGGASRAAGTDLSAFVGPREMLQRSSTEAGRRYRSWLEFSRKLRGDPRLLVYYSFEDQQPWDRTLLDQSARPGPRRHGGIVGCEWDEGRWPGKAALDFRRTSDRIRVDIPGEFDALTLMTWVRVDDFDHRLNSLLLADSWKVPGEVHWELNGDGVLIFALKGGARCNSPVVLGDDQLGLWTHLATVYAPRQRSLTHYVNGRPVKQKEIDENSRANIGLANIGNYSNPPPTEKSDEILRNFNGRIDEFLIFDDALEAREVQEIYEAGKPTS